MLKNIPEEVGGGIKIRFKFEYVMLVKMKRLFVFFFNVWLFYLFIFWTSFPSCLFTDASTRDKPVWQRKSALIGTPNSTTDNVLDSRNRFRRTRSRIQPDEPDRPTALTTPTTPVVHPAPVRNEGMANVRLQNEVD